MENKKIVTIQDISCYGQCSITVALPILSAYGFETAILPSAILSTHTAGFKNFTVLDLSLELQKIIKHWQDEKLSFDVLYSGYLGDLSHFEIIKGLKKNILKSDGLFILDPVMGDKGKLYPAFDNNYVNKMKDILSITDIILPNLTEACFLTDTIYKEDYDQEYILDIINKLQALGAKKIILTGIGYKPDRTGIVLYDGKYQYFEHEKLAQSYHGTGDIYSSTFIGIYLKTNDLFYAAKMAGLFVLDCIKNTIGDSSHPYGVKFEPLLVPFIKKLK